MWDDRYSDTDFAYGTEPNAFLAEEVHRLPAEGPILCLAEGEGRNAVWLAEQGYAVTAVDGSSVGLDKAARLARERGVTIECVCSDLAHYTIEPGKWAGIVSIFGHLPADLRPRVHRQVAAGLMPGGTLILEAYTPQQLAYGTGGPPVAEMMMDLARLEAELPSLEFEVAREIEREVIEGKYHTGAGHVVQLVARRPA